MDISFFHTSNAGLLCLILFVFMMIASILGFKSRQRNKIEAENLGPVEGSLFALLGLLLAFTFSMAGSRYDTRRSVMIAEVNNIGTAVLRADMYDDSSRNAFRNDFKKYIEARIAYYDIVNLKVIAAKELSSKYANALWKRAADLSKNPKYLSASNQMIPALNAMIDSTTIREASIQSKVPDIILLLLFVISIACGWLAGFEIPVSKRINWITVTVFSLLTTLVIYVILDLDQPRRGFINLDASQQLLKDLLKTF
jgi:hypothetical protein